MNKLSIKDTALCILTGICLCVAIWAVWMLCYAAVFDQGPANYQAGKKYEAIKLVSLQAGKLSRSAGGH